MKIPAPASLVVLACLVAAPVFATSEHQYAKGEYAIIRHGLAPNRQLSLASHGDGEIGDDGFHVWLMAEPAHRRIVALERIGSKNNLDTDPDAYHAFWSGDSRHVGVAFRHGRHEVQLNLYRIEHRRAHLITGPSLFKAVTRRDIEEEDDLRVLNAMVEWRRGNRFLLKEYRSFVADDDSLVKLLGTFGRVTEKLKDGRLAIEFSAEAECEALPGDLYRVVDLKPGKSGDSIDWWYK